MTTKRLSENRIRQIISEELLRESVDLISESEDLFEAQAEGGTTKAVQFVGEAAIDLMKTSEGRQVLAGALRLPIVLIKYYESAIGFLPEKGADLVGAKKGGFLRKILSGVKWLSSAPLKAAAIPMAKAAQWVGGMDDKMADFLVAGVEGRGERPDEPEDEESSAEEPPEEKERGHLPSDPSEPAEPKHVPPRQ